MSFWQLEKRRVRVGKKISFIFIFLKEEIILVRTKKVLLFFFIKKKEFILVFDY